MLIKYEKSKKNLIKLIIWTVLILAAFLFVLSNANKTRYYSSLQSYGFRRDFTALLTWCFGEDIGEKFFSINMRILRKSAHFIEYFAYGFCLCGLSVSIKRYFNKYNLFFWLFIMLLTSVADEFLQYFRAYRGSSGFDAGIDFFGAVCGYLLLSVFIVFIPYFIRKHKEKTGQ